MTYWPRTRNAAAHGERLSLLGDRRPGRHEARLHDRRRRSLPSAACSPSATAAPANRPRCGRWRRCCRRSASSSAAPISCEPEAPARSLRRLHATARKPKAAQLRAPPVVDLPLGATEDRVVGALDLERALAHGEKRFEPGLLAQANRGFLYIDEANLLEDHLVDLLLDVAASGVNVVEREGLSVRHPARFVLIGSGNPEEGELRPQMLDRFGLGDRRQNAAGHADPHRGGPAARRVRARSRGLPQGLGGRGEETARARSRARATRSARSSTPDAAIERATRLCLALGTDGLRGELTLIRAGARAGRARGRAKRSATPN